MGEEKVLGMLKGDKSIWLIVFLLFLISIAAVYSSSSSLAYRYNKTTFDLLIQHSKFVLFGIAALVVCYKIPLGWYRMLSFLALAGSIALLILTIAIGKSVNGAERWLNIGGFTFQPAEMAKIASILYMSRVFEKYKIESFKEFFVRVILPVGGTVFLIFIGSISASALLSLTLFIMFIIFGVKWSYIFKTGAIALAILSVAVLLNLSFGMFPRIDTGIKRIERFVAKDSGNEDKNLTPEEIQMKADKHYQEKMARLAVSSAGVLGKGPGNSTQRYLLPHPYSDYIFAIIVEEWGLIGGSVVIMLYLVFLFRSISLAKRCSHIFSIMTVIGLALLITFQAFLHILVNVGILPVTGHTLPLISLGGSSIIIMSAAFGIILSVSRTIDKSTTPEESSQDDGAISVVIEKGVEDEKADKE